MTIKDLNPNVDASIANVKVAEGTEPNIIILSDPDPQTLMIAACTAISNGNCEFVTGTPTTATLRKIA